MFGGLGIAWLLGLVVLLVSTLVACADITYRMIRKMDVKPKYGWPWLFRLVTYLGMVFGAVLWIGGLWLIRYFKVQ